MFWVVVLENALVGPHGVPVLVDRLIPDGPGPAVADDEVLEPVSVEVVHPTHLTGFVLVDVVAGGVARFCRRFLGQAVRMLPTGGGFDALVLGVGRRVLER